ncbi:glycosyltransferase family 4 protein [Hafnia alvei]|uniref:glycosyltransferase family 4 protein n=1 Tax=Hafnia alvei TaxID=569 RepID=UPI0028BDEE2D|nr:glycosyltransferase family 4 protein [Hafnia alvei]WNN51062.1 glycosyltransferase family 4 protein [Hafnia alvei]
MNILFIIPSLKKCGPVNVCFSLAKVLSKKHKVSIVAFKSGNAKEDFERVCEDVKVIPFFFMYRIVKYIKNSGFDVVHSHCLLPDLFLSLMSKVLIRQKFKTVSTIHNYIDVDYIYSKGYFIGWIMGFLNRLALRAIEIRVSCSDSVRDYCFDRYRLTSISIRNGVECKEWNCSVEHKDSVKFFYLGVLNKRKNVELVLDSFSEYKKISFNEDTLHILGGGGDLCALSKKYDQKDIIFHGNVEHPNSLIRCMDVYVSMSLAEGFPLAMLESISCGKPYICSNIDPHCEIDRITQCGLVIPPLKNELINAFENSHSWNFSAYSHHSVNKYRENFTNEIMAVNYLKIYELVNRKR